MNLLDKNGILDLRNYNQDFVWREHSDIIKDIKGFNVKGFKHNINFNYCTLFDKDGIDYLDLSGYKSKEISFFHSNINFKEINVKNSLGEISFYECKKLKK